MFFHIFYGFRSASCGMFFYFPFKTGIGFLRIFWNCKNVGLFSFESACYR
ncbi:hypothetical protein LEP1GSC062_1790 [Leptospira alexanderi serovar Manhao 3 str. L 60]|uniref:Uncharacterized protein n=1 Tax=Leptospira alexanderi serovar Manhao 3 str. L 60 TaxID=1049759 RepID=V6IAM9_9LEPT|nr:hypothetical protein LEP1GSC062_1790 [Leptospira alexanderi serovar Manhao 3 str. L 60]